MIKRLIIYIGFSSYISCLGLDDFLNQQAGHALEKIAILPKLQRQYTVQKAKLNSLSGQLPIRKLLLNKAQEKFHQSFNEYKDSCVELEQVHEEIHSARRKHKKHIIADAVIKMQSELGLTSPSGIGSIIAKHLKIGQKCFNMKFSHDSIRDIIQSKDGPDQVCEIISSTELELSKLKEKCEEARKLRDIKYENHCHLKNKLNQEVEFSARLLEQYRSACDSLEASQNMLQKTIKDIMDTAIAAAVFLWITELMRRTCELQLDQ